jgi:serine/threonine protein kinase
MLQVPPAKNAGIFRNTSLSSVASSVASSHSHSRALSPQSPRQVDLTTTLAQQGENTVLGDYVLTKLLGSGGFSRVYAAKHKTDASKCAAVKLLVLREARMNNGDARLVARETQKRRRMFQSELQINEALAAIPQDNIVQLLTPHAHCLSTVDTDTPYEQPIFSLSFELCSGGDLFDMMDRTDGLSRAQAACFFQQLCRAAAHVHSLNIAHLDIKPENLFIHHGVLKLGDFGLASFTDKDGTVVGSKGSRNYMSPEVVAARKQTLDAIRGGNRNARDHYPYNGRAADMWSCAIVLHVMLFFCAPWEQADEDADAEYRAFRSSGMGVASWAHVASLPDAALILESLLSVAPADRATADELVRFFVASPHWAQDGPSTTTATSATTDASSTSSASTRIPTSSSLAAAAAHLAASRSHPHPSPSLPELERLTSVA